MSLPAQDIEYLGGRATDHLVAGEANMTCVLIPNFPLPDGYNRPVSDLLLRLNPGYPDVPPDMWWFDPPVRRADGKPIEATQHSEMHLGRTWQRWSRHLNGDQWRSGVDSLETFIALVRRELVRCARTT